MPVTWRYQPPAVSPIAALVAARETAGIAGARELLVQALPLVPFDTGALYASGTYEVVNGKPAVLFSAVNEEDNYDYAAVVHEDMTAEHPHGQAKYLETPMNNNHAPVAAAIAAVFKAAL